MMRIFVAVVVLAINSTLAQTTKTPEQLRYEEALARLQAKAATQPSEVERLRRENSELRATIAKLTAEVKRLTGLITKPAAVPAKKVWPGDQIKIGMTVAEVRELMGKQGTRELYTETTETIRWDEDDNRDCREIVIRFQNGKASVVSVGEWRLSPFAPDRLR